jgi:hypothetical protein
MSADDDPTTVRDLKIMRLRRMDAGSRRYEKKVEDELRREQWRRDRERERMATPPTPPRSGL